MLSAKVTHNTGFRIEKVREIEAKYCTEKEGMAYC